MLAFIAGGAASGKSAWAESLAMALGGRKCYIATMEPFGEEAEIRIQHHRNARREKGFQTAEIYTGMAHSVDTLCCDTACGSSCGNVSGGGNRRGSAIPGFGSGACGI